MLTTIESMMFLLGITTEMTHSPSSLLRMLNSSFEGDSSASSISLFEEKASS